MHIWVDADACPGVIKEILFRSAERTCTQLTLVANHNMRIPKSPLIQFNLAAAGFDEADNLIAERVETGDLVITQDIPLAAEVIDKGAIALSPRGELFDANNIRGRLGMRDFMDTMRASGIDTGGPPALNQTDRRNFANHLDRLLTRSAKQDKQ